MSLCRIIIRLEIADTSEHVMKLNFKADKIEPSENNCDSSQLPNCVSIFLNEQQIALYKGRRPYQKITMEHYVASEDSGQNCGLNTAAAATNANVLLDSDHDISLVDCANAMTEESFGQPKK